MRRWRPGDLVITQSYPCSLWTLPGGEGAELIDVCTPGVIGVVLSCRDTMVEVALSSGPRGWMSKPYLRRLFPGAWARNAAQRERNQGSPRLD